MRYPDGSVNRGEWVSGLCEGYGELTTSDCEIISGTWEKGRFVYIPVVAIAMDQQELALTEGQDPVQFTVTMLPFDSTNQ